MRQRPDTALALLKKLDREKLKNLRTRAKYSLLYAMALDKNGIDTTDLSIISPALEYYGKKHSTCQTSPGLDVQLELLRVILSLLSWSK